MNGSNPQTVNNPLHIAFIGDSLTEYFDWQERFPDHLVLNLGISGEPVEGLLGRIDSICSSLGDPDVIFFMTGINNIAMEDYEFVGSYRNIIRKIAACFPGARIVIQSILPVILSWISPAKISEVNHSLEKTAERCGADYLDIHSSFLKSDGSPQSSFLLDDGVHLSSQGYRIWSDIIDAYLNRAINK